MAHQEYPYSPDQVGMFRISCNKAPILGDIQAFLYEFGLRVHCQWNPKSCVVLVHVHPPTTADSLLQLADPLKRFGEFQLPEGAHLTDDPSNIPLYTVIADCHGMPAPTYDMVVAALPDIMLYKINIVKPPKVCSAKVFLAVRHHEDMHAIMNIGTIKMGGHNYVLQESWGNYDPYT